LKLTERGNEINSEQMISNQSKTAHTA